MSKICLAKIKEGKGKQFSITAKICYHKNPAKYVKPGVDNPSPNRYTYPKTFYMGRPAPDRKQRTGPILVSRKDRLGALALALLVLVYMSISSPWGKTAVYIARVDSMALKPVKNYYLSDHKDADPVTYKKWSAKERSGSSLKENTPFSRRNYLGYPLAPNSTHGSTEAGSRNAFYKKRNPVALSLNGADSAALEQLPGIGPVLASRIVRYREKLGGFYNVAQLREVYGISDSLYLFLEPYWAPLFQENTGSADKIDAGSGTKVAGVGSANNNDAVASKAIRKININTEPLHVLSKHPYLLFKNALAIVRYREANGPFSSPRDLEKIRALDSTTLSKLLPYVQTDKSVGQSP